MRTPLHAVFVLLLPLAVQGRCPEELKTLTLKQHVISGESIEVQYTLPYDGMVEFRLFAKSDTGYKMMYRAQYIQAVGENGIRLKANRIPSGQYKYQVSYKGKDFYGEFSFTNPDPDFGKPKRRKPAPKREETPEEIDLDDFGIDGGTDDDSGTKDDDWDW